MIVTVGAQHAIALLARVLVGRGDPVLVESPTYPHAHEALRAAGGRLVSVPVDPPRWVGRRRARRDPAPLGADDGLRHARAAQPDGRDHADVHAERPARGRRGRRHGRRGRRDDGGSSASTAHPRPRWPPGRRARS
ncbi:aminotransferase class I/II-fold pyridoxal phosphate-dependent enzyme [Curtobacterium sp. MCJR17_043]|uniref:aminotransferase class I/II-fold pyridoxal phosphate-dependent enzyme n=1 Tax=Curtobacterium sp. MCJR17_043 TaxID=2175660 RepID=UPI0024DF906E|nr:aminotransferase class I/II-fold pyridoxal phosphate-dependent enzyme [Curtobacterium sp. MCJR17_043]WIB36570.1 aminotransferase class I/II-fold pyridoxal phosphate-dependent enzyme [Curtobacterium sp. MCJR17_043]